MQIIVDNLIWRIEEDEIWKAWPIWWCEYLYSSQSYKEHISWPTRAQIWLDPVLKSVTLERMMEKIKSVSHSIDYHTNSKFNIEAYYDYNDSVDYDRFVKWVSKHRAEFDTKEEALAFWHDYLEEEYREPGSVDEYYYSDIIAEWDLDDEDAWEIRNYFMEYLWIFYFDYQLDHFDSQDIPLNLYLASPDEINYDLWPVGYIASYYNETPAKDIDYKDDCFDPNVCFVAKLTELQGFTMKQLFRADVDYVSRFDKKQKSKYIKTMRDELNNFYHVCWIFTVLQENTIEWWISLLCVKDQTYHLHNWPWMGLFAPVVGWGSMFEVKLDSSIDIEASYIYAVDSTDRFKVFEYSPSDVYGYRGSDYKE